MSKKPALPCLGHSDPALLPLPPATVDCSQCGRAGLTRHQMRACMYSTVDRSGKVSPSVTDNPPAKVYKRYDWTKDLPCSHRGESQLTLLCGCGGGTAVPLYPCGLGGECIAVYMSLHRSHPTIARTVKVCDNCHDRAE